MCIIKMKKYVFGELLLLSSRLEGGTCGCLTGAGRRPDCKCYTVGNKGVKQTCTAATGNGQAMCC